MSDSTDIAVFTPDEAGALALLHALAFDDPWDAGAFSDLMSQTGVFALGRDGEGFILCRVVADEAEILTLATVPDRRRRGAGRRLVEAAVGTAARMGATRLFLEVAEDNAAARALYERTGFVEVGRRRGYYARPGGAARDALVLARDLIERLPSG